MATCPMCNVEVDDAEMDNHTKTKHADTGGDSAAGGEDTSATPPATPPTSEPAQ